MVTRIARQLYHNETPPNQSHQYLRAGNSAFSRLISANPLPAMAGLLELIDHPRGLWRYATTSASTTAARPGSGSHSISARILMKPLLFALCVVFTFGGLSAQTPAWQPSPGHTQVPIWPAAVPDAQPVAGPEHAEAVTAARDLVAGKSWIAVEQVSRPTMTVYSPKGRNTGVAMVVFPGGGYSILAIDLEGTEVCDWATSRGITCVLLKYRVPDSGPAYHDDCKCNIHPKAPRALEDAQRTVGLVRLHAVEWHIDPHKIGVLGFSAGGHLVANISTHFAKRSYAPVDAADKVSCRPDFAVAIYPGHMLENTTREFELNPEIGIGRRNVACPETSPRSTA
jgi:acetyl esterase/lipase